MSVPDQPCVVLVPSSRVYDAGVEEAFAEVSRRGYPVWRVRNPDPAPDTRDRMVADALAAGFIEILLAHPAVLFDPHDVDRLRSHNLSLVCGVYPLVAANSFACEFLPGNSPVRFGRGGALTEVATCGLGFALVRRELFDVVRPTLTPTPDGIVPYFSAPSEAPSVGPVLAGDATFCKRVRWRGFRIMADTAIRLWHVGPHRYGWEDVNGDRDRTDMFTFRVADSTTDPDAPRKPRRNPLRGQATPLPTGFPRVKAFVVTYPANADSLALTLESLRTSDWGEEPVVVTQPLEWSVDREPAPANYRRALEAAAADGCDFALILEDDVRVNRHLRHNLLANLLVVRDQCDYLSLFVPDLVADPWERCQPHLGYRLAKPRYTGPDTKWEKWRLWGSQALLLSRRLILAALDQWDRFGGLQDARVLAACGAHNLPLCYTAPCLVEHAPLRTAFDTPPTLAPDFDSDFRLEVGAGFEPPEDVPGWLTRAEAEQLWQTATGRAVLELGTTSGQSAVCLAQSARWLVSVGGADQSEAAEWVRRFGLAKRVEFVRGDPREVCNRLTGRFGLVFIDSRPDEAGFAQDIATALPLLESGGLLAVHHYPDPEWPHVRRVVDEYARRHGWKRVGQVEYLAIFRT